MAEQLICSIPDCNKPSVCRGWCDKHYTRFKRHGSPTFTKTAPEGEGLNLLLSLKGHRGSDCVIWPYSRNPQGYGQTYYCGEVMGAHRVMCTLEYGDPPSPFHQSAHSCGNGRGGCINPDHLRWATPKENIADKFGPHGWALLRSHDGKIIGQFRSQ